jgi:hypothetical protein
LKSTKSFRAKASINQEYSQKILDLDKAVRHIERMNEKNVRFNTATVSASAHRINSVDTKGKDSSSAILSQQSSFSEENKTIDQRKDVSHCVEVKVNIGPIQNPAPEISQEEEKPVKATKVIKLTDNPLRSGQDSKKHPEKEIVTLRTVEDPIAKFIDKNNATAEVKDALTSLRTVPVQKKVDLQPAKEKEFQQLQLNPVAISTAQLEVEKTVKVPSILEMAKSSLRQIEKSEEDDKSTHSEDIKDTSLPVLQLRKVDSIDAAPEEAIRNDSEKTIVFATKRDSLRVVPNKRGSMVSTVEVPIVAENNNANGLDVPAEEERKPDEKIEVSTVADASTVAEPKSKVVIEDSSDLADGVCDSAVTTRKLTSIPDSPNIARTNSDRSKNSQPQIFVNAPIQRLSSMKESNLSNQEEDAASETSRLSSRSNISLKQAKESANPSATDISSVPRGPVDIEHLKDSLRPTPAKDSLHRHEVEEQEQDLSENILRAKEHLHRVVTNQDKGREEDSHKWADPILQARGTLRPILREKDVSLKEFSCVADNATSTNERAGDVSSSSPSIVKEAVTPPATEFERKASVFGKLVRKMSGLMDRNTAVAMSSALTAQNHQVNDTGSGAALFEAAAAGEAENHSASRAMVRDASYDPTNRHHDHDDDDDDDDAIVNDDDFLGDLSTTSSMPKHKTPQKSAPGSDVKVVSLTKANLDRTMTQRAESFESMGPGATFRGSFSTGHKKLSFTDENQAQNQTTPASRPMSPEIIDANASFTMSPAIAISTIENLTPGQIEVPDASPKELGQETASQVTGSETESQIKKKKSGMNFIKGLRKRTSSIFGSKSGSNFDIATDSNDSPSGGAMTPTADAFSPTQRPSAVSETGSELGPDDSASQSDKRKKSGGFSSFIRSTSMFRRSKSGNYATGNTNDVVIPEDEEVDFSELPTPIGGSEKIMSFDQQQDEMDETGSQLSTASEKKKRLTMKGLMKRTSSLFKK